MPRRSDARPKAIATTARLLQEQGYAATGLEQVLAESGAPKGSFYFHFPGGKEQLAVEAVRASGELVAAVIESVLADTASPGAAVRAFATLQAAQLAGSDYTRGCPVATVALERAGRPSPEGDDLDRPSLGAAAAAAFASWLRPLGEAFGRAGCAAPDELAEAVLAAMEGALILARARRDAEVVVRIGERMGTMVDDAVRRPDGAG